MPLSLLEHRGRIIPSPCSTKILWLLIVSWSLWEGLTVMASSFDSCLSVTASSGAVVSEPMILPDFLIRSLFGMLVSSAVVRPPPRHSTAKKTALASNQMKCFPNASDLFFDLGKSPQKASLDADDPSVHHMNPTFLSR